MGINRRDFLKIAGLSTLFGLGGKGAWELLRPGQVEAALQATPQTLAAQRWAMAVDMRKLVEATAQRCISIITTPSARLKVAWVGHTRTQGGLLQWLQSNRNFIWWTRSDMTSGSSPGKVLWKGSVQIHLT